jgi:hypothetical protein
MFTTINSFSAQLARNDPIATIVSSISAYKQLIADIPPYGIYSADSWNSSTNTLTDLTGNGHNATTSSVTFGTETGNGALASISYLSGTTVSGITWPQDSISKTFTICSLTRYASATTNANRILTATSYNNLNFLHGHWNGGVAPLAGVAYYGDSSNGFMTNTQTSQVTPINNWVNMCGTNSASVSFPNNILANKTPVGIKNGVALTTTGQMAINASEKSDFRFSQLIIFNTALTQSQMVIVSNAMNTYLTTGILQ